MQKFLILLSTTFLISFSGPAVVQAQTAAPSATNDTTAQVDAHDDDGFDIGWLGLLGLIGLAGLRGRNHHHVRTDTPS